MQVFERGAELRWIHRVRLLPDRSQLPEELDHIILLIGRVVVDRHPARNFLAGVLRYYEKVGCKKYKPLRTHIILFNEFLQVDEKNFTNSPPKVMVFRGL